ncbi:hypothetical protein [Cellulomonas sp. PhB143]|uniref:hypothetical protein n=1 Tax=Cellulomonas sp. PhB143 TaxID=2485186 RepID=UPI000F9B67B1|nr:hypothetical protein EDF32_0184 [Cellulomonas sp. PhB143]
MSNTVTVSPTRGVRGIGLLSIIAGIILIVAGAVTWITVSSQLDEQKITVSDDADFLAGDQVNGPFSAYAQAEVIDKHALEATGGKTYAELDQDDPTRETAMTASFLRASLFTSVVAYGVCALVFGLGIMFILLGVALRRLAGGPSVSIESAGDDSSARGAAAAAAPAAAAPAAAPVAPAPAAAAPAPAAPAPAASAAPAEGQTSNEPADAAPEAPVRRPAHAAPGAAPGEEPVVPPAAADQAPASPGPEPTDEDRPRP